MICKICSHEFNKNHFNQKLCSEKCKKQAKLLVKKKYKESEKGKSSNSKWIKSERRIKAQSKYKKSEIEKNLSRNRAKIYHLTRKGILKDWFNESIKNGCIKCGSKEKLSVDHIIPYSKSKDNSLNNLQILCLSCNSKKGSNG